MQVSLLLETKTKRDFACSFYWFLQGFSGLSAENFSH